MKKTPDLPKQTDCEPLCPALLGYCDDQIYPELRQEPNSLGRLDVLAHAEVVSCYRKQGWL